MVNCNIVYFTSDKSTWRCKYNTHNTDITTFVGKLDDIYLNVCQYHLILNPIKEESSKKKKKQCLKNVKKVKIILLPSYPLAQC